MFEHKMFVELIELFKAESTEWTKVMTIWIIVIKYVLTKAVITF
jgi:hypothetical protein